MTDLPDWTRRFLTTPVQSAEVAFTAYESGALTQIVAAQAGVRYEVVSLTITATAALESQGYDLRGICEVTLQDVTGTLARGAVSPEAPAWQLPVGQSAIISREGEQLYVQGTMGASLGRAILQAFLTYREVT